MQRSSSRTPALLALLVAAIALAALWWWSDRLGPQRSEGPRRFASTRAAPPPEASSLTLPIEVSFAELARSVEDQVPEVVLELAGEPLQGGYVTDLMVRRPGPVRARGQGDRLLVQVPLSVQAKAYRAKRAERRAEKGREAPEGIAVSFNAVLELQMALAIDSEWHLGSTTELGIRWIDPPTLELGPLKIPIVKPVEKALSAQLAQVAASVDAQLAERDEVRHNLERAWAELSAPRKLQQDPPVWLVGTPEALYASDPVIFDDHLGLTVGYRGTFTTVLGDPGPAPTPAPLPARSDPPDAPGFSLVLPAVLQWETLSAIAAGELEGREWTAPGSDAVVRLDGIELYPSGDRIAVRVDYSARHTAHETDGTLYLTGRPEIRDRSVVIADFGYVLDTWDSAVWSANLLAESGLEQAIGERLVFDYGARLDAVLATANQGLSTGRSTDDGGTMRGSLDRVEILGLWITEEALVVDVRAGGSLQLQAKPKPRDPVGMERPGPPERRRH